MSRWKAPRPRSSPYITAAGYARLQEELKELWQRRAEVTKALSAAAAEGDRSENAEYIYRKKELREIDSRIRYLQKRMPELNVVSSISDPEKVFFGAQLKLENEAGESLDYQIVGADELGKATDKISVDSPLAKALLGKRADEEVTVQIGSEEKTYYIVAISYSLAT